jgi:hypothetical protein
MSNVVDSNLSKYKLDFFVVSVEPFVMNVPAIASIAIEKGSNKPLQDREGE